MKCQNNTAEGGVTRNVCFGDSVGAALAETVDKKGVFKRSLLHSPRTDMCREQCSDVQGIGFGNRVNHIHGRTPHRVENSMV